MGGRLSREVVRGWDEAIEEDVDLGVRIRLFEYGVCCFEGTEVDVVFGGGEGAAGKGGWGERRLDLAT